MGIERVIESMEEIEEVILNTDDPTNTTTKTGFPHGSKPSLLTFPDGYHNVAFAYVSVGVYTPTVKNCGHKMKC